MANIFDDMRAAEFMWTKAGGEIDESCAVAGSAMALAINDFLAEYDAAKKLVAKDAMVDRLAEAFRLRLKFKRHDEHDNERDARLLAEYDATKAGGKWVGEEFFPNDPQRETAQGEVFGYVFNDISGAEHFHRGKNVPSLAQSDIRALYTSPPTRAPGIKDASDIVENIHMRMEDSPFNKYEEEFLAEPIDAGVRVEVGK